MTEGESRMFKRIRAYTPADLRYWTETLGCSEQQLWDAIASVGNSVPAIRVFLDSSMEQSWNKVWGAQATSLDGVPRVP